MTKRTQLNKSLGKFGQLRPGSLRYRFIQNLGYFLWGRKLGYLSWWQHAGRTSSVMFFYQGKLLLGKRAPTVPDRPNVYGLVGGFVDDFETFAEGLSREIKEECGLEIAPDNFPWDNAFSVHERVTTLKEQENIAVTQLIFIHELSTEQVASLTTTSEVSEFLWVDAAALKKLKSENLLHITDRDDVFERAFRRMHPEQQAQKIKGI